MINKCFFLLFCLPCFIFAHEWSVQARAGYFYPVDETLRKIYHNGGAEGELEGNYWFYKGLGAWGNGLGAWGNGLSIWGNVSYFDREGRSIGMNDETRLRLVPLSAGVKYYYPITSYFDVYAGVGGSYTFTRLRDQSPCEERIITRGDGGVVGKFGLFFTFKDHILLDVFADYYYTRVRFEPDVVAHRVDVGGLRTGVGIGVVY